MSLIFLLAFLPSVFALRLPLTRATHNNVFATAAEIGDDSLDLKTVRDLIYLANITIGGTEYPVQIDTGSSDLWIKPSSTDALPNVEETSTQVNLTYGLGWAYGKLSYADVGFSGVNVSKQAFVHASSVQNPALSYGAEGILGLGFTALSKIDVTESQADNSARGRSLLWRMFDQDKSAPNFIAFSLQRSTDSTNTVDGAFSIGEYDPEYTHVANLASIPTFPESSPSRWNVLVDAIILGQNVTIPTTTIPDAPANKAVALLDTGTSYTYVPEGIAEAIYSSASGAYLDKAAGYWKVPCNVEIDVAIQIGGQVYPLHPLDVTPVSLTDSTVCIGSFVPQTVSVAEGQFDWLIGDNVLRSMYNVYDFGDYDSSGNIGDPYVKLLSIVDPDEASKSFAAARGSTAKTGITYNSADGTRADSKTTSVTLSTDVAKSLNMLGTVFPVILAVMGLNALLLLAALIFGAVYLCRRKKRRAPARTNRGRLTPMPLDVRHSYVPGHADATPTTPHAYQPVSMAMTEDTFVPPTPSYAKFGESKIMPGDRPRSMAVPLREAQGGLDEPFIPPSPAFHNDGSTLRPGAAGRPMADRPHSMA